MPRLPKICVTLCSWFLATLVVLPFGTANAAAGELLVGAAISLSDAMQVLGPAFSKTTGGKTTLRFDFAASSTILRQIESGAPIDIFLSADEATMDKLSATHRLLAGSRVDFATNALVLVVRAAAPGDPAHAPIHTPEDLTAPTVKKVALCPPAVPVGHYGYALLTSLGLADKLSSKLVPAENVRAALALVEAGAVDAGFVYASDATSAGSKVQVVYQAPAGRLPAVVYPGAVVEGSKQADAAKAWLAYLRTPAAQQVLQRYGFLPAPH